MLEFGVTPNFNRRVTCNWTTDFAQLTLSCWIKYTGYTDFFVNYLMFKDSVFIWYIDDPALNNTGRLEFVHYFDTTNGTWSTAASTIVTPNLYHVAVTYDNSSAANDPIFYINGVLSATTELTAPVGTRLTFATDHVISDADPSTNRSGPGPIADFRLYSRILSGAEIATIFACRGRDGILNGLEARYLMNEAADGTTASGANSVKSTGPVASRNGTPANSPVYRAETLGLSFRKRVG
jgi:hypothetical protein